jgi:hypothetical protein
VAWAHPPKRQMIVVSKMLLCQERADGIALPPASCYRCGFKSSRQDDFPGGILAAIFGGETHVFSLPY